jgi:hypothetical protein
VMTKYDAEGQYAPNVEWAFAKWQATPGLNFRAGRMGAPMFMISDFRDVGYANTTVRPPLDVYGQVPISHFDGADVSYQLNLGSATVTTTLWGGDSSAPYSSSLNKPPVDVVIKRQFGLNVLAELSEGLSLRLGRSQGKLSIKNSVASDQLTAGASTTAGLRAPIPANALPKYVASASNGAFAGIGGPASAAAAQAAIDQLATVQDLLNPESVQASFTGIGLAYDQDNWVGSVEYTKRKTKSYISDTTGWYTTVGYRINKYTPYVGYSKIKSDRRSTNPLTPTSLSTSSLITNLGGSQPALAALAAGLDSSVASEYAGINQVLGTQKQDEKTITLGVRWDATSSMAVKAQFDRVRKPADSNGMFLIADPAQASAQAFQNESRSVNVLTLSVDFVF